MFYILAYEYKGKFKPEKLIDKLEYELSGLEYGDVVNDEYQIWEYPSGRVYQVQSDRDVQDADFYSTPYNDKGTVWQPNLVHIKTDKEQVEKAYLSLVHKGNAKSLLRRIFRKP